MPHNGSTPIGQPLLVPDRPERALGVALLAYIAFHQPFLRLFDAGPTSTLGGVPVLFLYLFAAWAVVIVLTALVMESEPTPAEADLPPRGDEEPDMSGNASSRQPPTT